MYKVMIGILLDEHNELVVKNNGLQLGDITMQNQKILLLSNKGEIKEHPLAGVGLLTFLHENNPDDLIREIRKEFVRDGMTINNLKHTQSGEIITNAYYKNESD